MQPRGAAVGHTPTRTYGVSDITHLILDNLSSDKKSLASCSLVCTDWTFIARLHLFATVHLHGHRANEFHAFLQSHGATSIKNHIRSLQWIEADDGALDIGDLCRISVLLPRTNTLHLSFNRFKSRPTAFPYKHAKACLSSIHHLSVRCRLRLNGQQNNVQPLCEFLTWFNLSHLDLDSIKDTSVAVPVDPYRVSHVPIPSRSLQVRKLTFLNGDAVYQEADIMMRVLGHASNLRSLTYRISTSEDVYALGKLLRSSAKNLTTLTIYCDPDIGRGAFITTNWHKLYLTYCKSLVTMSLPNFWIYPQHLCALFDVLACDAESLSKLILGVSEPLTISPKTPWNRLENLLFSLRESVIICVDLRAVADRGEQKLIKNRIESQWTSLSRHGRLEFQGYDGSKI
ncbi:hypothetical protein BDY19DRAFT_994014 [Irpex rosettiformis]|uniref:Uncharacterized protein n=1 Tax=Irpex rosettiformis TaxID=378272 RepID=A0ACB8U355_9APHY|nr:hypothetical protein BDY19DRAFT_994014 [Irpex rosettiformis]